VNAPIVTAEIRARLDGVEPPAVSGGIDMSETVVGGVDQNRQTVYVRSDPSQDGPITAWFNPARSSAGKWSDHYLEFPKRTIASHFSDRDRKEIANLRRPSPNRTP
jgi:hypothetical protein